MNGAAFLTTLLRGDGRVSDLCAVEFLQPPKYARWEGKKKKKTTGGRGKGSGRESLGGEEGGETGKPSIRRTGCANQSEARSGAAAAEPRSPARSSAEPAPGSPRTSAASASTGKVPSMMLAN